MENRGRPSKTRPVPPCGRRNRKAGRGRALSGWAVALIFAPPALKCGEVFGVEEMLWVEGGRPLMGEVTLPAAKNSVLPLLAAALLCDGPVTLRGVPCLADVEQSILLLGALGCAVGWQGRDLVVQPPSARPDGILPEGPVRAMRSSVFYLAPVLHAAGRVSMPMPGGCDLGPRPIDIHLDGLVRMGATVCWQQSSLCLACPPAGLRGADITLRLPSVGATETLLMAAARAHGATVLRGAACEPEIVDLAGFLQRCGARITGAGTPVIWVQGALQLGGTVHTPIPDRIVAATAAAAVAGAGGRVLLRRCEEAQLGPVAQVLRNAGCEVGPQQGGLLVARCGPLRGVGRVYTGGYPAFATDAAPVVAAGLLTARGTSAFEDTIFENRFSCAEGFAAMGAKVQRRGRALEIAGPARLHGAQVAAPDLRGGAALVVAALAAQGQSRVTGLAHIRRGYEDIAALFCALGAKTGYSGPDG